MSKIAELVEAISNTIFPHNFDHSRRVDLNNMLLAFADEIKRSAIEP